MRRPDPIELRGVHRTIVARRARLQRDLELLARLFAVAEPGVRDRQPEAEFVVVGGATYFPLEQVPRRQCNPPSRRAASPRSKKLVRRVGLELLQRSRESFASASRPTPFEDRTRFDMTCALPGSRSRRTQAPARPPSGSRGAGRSSRACCTTRKSAGPSRQPRGPTNRRRRSGLGQRFRGAIVHEHRGDRVLFDGLGANAPQIPRRKKINGHRSLSKRPKPPSICRLPRLKFTCPMEK